LRRGRLPGLGLPQQESSKGVESSARGRKGKGDSSTNTTTKNTCESAEEKGNLGKKDVAGRGKFRRGKVSQRKSTPKKRKEGKEKKNEPLQ